MGTCGSWPVQGTAGSCAFAGKAEASASTSSQAIYIPSLLLLLPCPALAQLTAAVGAVQQAPHLC